MRRGKSYNSDITPELIKGQVRSRMLELARELAPHGRLEGRDWVALNPCRADGHAGSFRIQVSGPEAGRWVDFAVGAKGDGIDLVSYIQSNGGNYQGAAERKEAFRWLGDWLGLTGYDPKKIQKARDEAADMIKRDEAAAREQRERLSKLAQRIWHGAKPIEDTPAERYLQGRGIDCRAVLGRFPGSLRYSPAQAAPKAWSAEKGAPSHHPTLIAAIHTPACGRDPIAIHRTYLSVQRDGGVTKADLPQGARAVLGPMKGGTIRLWRGASNKPLGAAPEGDTLVLAEGVEDGLSIAIARPELRVLASVSIGNLRDLVFPAAIGDVIIAADNDTGKEAVAHLDKAIERFLAMGLNVRCARSPVGKDANDLMRYEVGK